MLILNTKLVYLVFVSCCVLNVAGQRKIIQFFVELNQTIGLS